jgi:hypothetical protein
LQYRGTIDPKLQKGQDHFLSIGLNVLSFLPFTGLFHLRHRLSFSEGSPQETAHYFNRKLSTDQSETTTSSSSGNNKEQLSLYPSSKEGRSKEQDIIFSGSRLSEAFGNPIKRRDGRN